MAVEIFAVAVAVVVRVPKVDGVLLRSGFEVVEVVSGVEGILREIEEEEEWKRREEGGNSSMTFKITLFTNVLLKLDKLEIRGIISTSA